MVPSMCRWPVNIYWMIKHGNHCGERALGLLQKNKNAMGLEVKEGRARQGWRRKAQHGLTCLRVSSASHHAENTSRSFNPRWGTVEKEGGARSGEFWMPYQESWAWSYMQWGELTCTLQLDHWSSNERINGKKGKRLLVNYKGLGNLSEVAQVAHIRTES